MENRNLRERLSAQAAEWRHAGLIDDVQLAILQRRWRPRPGLGAYLIKGLSLLAALLLGSSLLGFVGVLLADASPILTALLLLALAAALGRLGAGLSGNPERSLPLTGQILLTMALLSLFAALVLFSHGLGGAASSRPTLVGASLMTAAAALFTAYHYALRWPLFLGLLLLFHGIGSSHGYLGHGGYFAGIHDERLMAAVAALATAFGVWHERAVEGRHHSRQPGFGHLYIVFGLLYFNLSLWFLTLPYGGAVWMLSFTTAGIAQLVAGARLKDARFTGFGIVFLGIDLYTRLFEQFWDELHKGGLLLLAGGVAMAAGVLLERAARRRRQGEQG